jgi:hypothetical protein
MSDTTPAPDERYSDGKSENFDGEVNALTDDAPVDDSPDGRVTTPTAADTPATTTTGSVEGDSVVMGGTGAPDTDADPEPPAEPEVIEEGEEPSEEPETEVNPGVVTPDVEAEVVVAPEPSVIDESESRGIWTTWRASEGQWFNVEAGGALVTEPFETKEDAQAAGREVAKERGVEHFIKKKDGSIGERNSYGNDPESREG